MWPNSPTRQLCGCLAQQKCCGPPVCAGLSQLEGQQHVCLWQLRVVAGSHADMHRWVSPDEACKHLKWGGGTREINFCTSHRKKAANHPAAHFQWKLFALESREIRGSYGSVQGNRTFQEPLSGQFTTLIHAIIFPTLKVTYAGRRDYQRHFYDNRKRFLSSTADRLELCLNLLPVTNYSVTVTALTVGFTATIATNTSLPGITTQPEPNVPASHAPANTKNILHQ